MPRIFVTLSACLALLAAYSRAYWALLIATVLLWLACALLWPFPLRAAPDPHFSARWDSATSATIQWTQAQRGCLYRLSASGERGFVGCYERTNATITITLGHVGPLSGDLRPMAGDVYILVTDGQQFRAPLIGRAQYLPAFY